MYMKIFQFWLALLAFFSKNSAKNWNTVQKNEIVTMQKVRIIQKIQTLRVTKFSNKIVYIKMIYFACDQRMDMIA